MPTAGNEPQAPASVRFIDVAKVGGVDWTGRNGEEAELFTVLETLGTGCAIDDFDLDGQLDLFFAGGGRFTSHKEILPLPIALYRQETKWTFEPVTNVAGLQRIRHYNHGTWTADFDDDGFSDLVITGWGGLQLFQNRGDGTFADVTDGSGLTDSLWSTAAGWADLNRDHVLDLFVGHYVDWSFENDPLCREPSQGRRLICDPLIFKGLPYTVYLGNGDGTFRDAGVDIGIHEIGKVLGVVIADVNGDRQPDVYVANDTVRKHLYQPSASGHYREVGIENGVALGENGGADGSMGVDLGDLDGDGRTDLWVANYENQSFALYRNMGNDLFTHASRAFGITAVGTLAVGFGTVLFDADGDGFLDIFCSNGHVWAPSAPRDRRQEPFLFWNDHGKRFVDIAPSAGDYMRQRHLGRGAASGDLDANGAPDLVVTHTNEPVAILRNDTPISNWLAVRLIGRTSVRSAIGAQVSITFGHRSQTGFIKGGGSYLSTSDRTLLFGLGDSTSVETLEVHWPSGRRTNLTNIPACQHLQLLE